MRYVHNRHIYFSQSPITFAPVLDQRFSLPLEEGLDFGAAPPEEPNVEAQVRQETPPPKYSPIVKMGLFLLVPYFFLVLLVIDLT